jgi:hypothetical protein
MEILVLILALETVPSLVLLVYTIFLHLFFKEMVQHDLKKKCKELGNQKF